MAFKSGSTELARQQGYQDHVDAGPRGQIENPYADRSGREAERAVAVGVAPGQTRRAERRGRGELPALRRRLSRVLIASAANARVVIEVAR